jgi:hypothetical protein
MSLAEKLAEDWRSRLASELPNQPEATRESIVSWLLGENRSRFEDLDPALRPVTEQAMDFRYRILRERYLDVGRDRAYRQLIQRLGSVFLIRSKIKTWIALSRDRRQSVVDVLEEVVPELLQNDTYMKQQMLWIHKCTRNSRLRDALLLASAEEYCLRPIRNQPLLLYRFVNYLRRTQRGGMTQVPADEFLRFVSNEIAPDDSEGTVNLLDDRAIAEYLEAQAVVEQQELRESVRQHFEGYLEQQVGSIAADWLRLYLQGRSQDEIAQALEKPVKEIYRLREKVTYHATRVFATKSESELVTNWLSGDSKA